MSFIKLTGVRVKKKNRKLYLDSEEILAFESDSQKRRYIGAFVDVKNHKNTFSVRETVKQIKRKMKNCGRNFE